MISSDTSVVGNEEYEWFRNLNSDGYTIRLWPDSWGITQISVLATDQKNESFETFRIIISEEVLGLYEAIRPVVYPNPVSDYIHIEGEASKAEIKVYNQAGKLFFDQDNGLMGIPVDTWPDGVYTLIIGERVIKIIKN